MGKYEPHWHFEMLDEAGPKDRAIPVVFRYINQ